MHQQADPNEREPIPFPIPQVPQNGQVGQSQSQQQPQQQKPQPQQQPPTGTGVAAIQEYQYALALNPYARAFNLSPEQQHQLAVEKNAILAAMHSAAASQKPLRPASSVSERLVILHQAMNAGLLDVVTAVADTYERFAHEFTQQTGHKISAQDVRTLVERTLDIAAD